LEADQFGTFRVAVVFEPVGVGKPVYVVMRLAGNGIEKS
jgi:hypothetical protein